MKNLTEKKAITTFSNYQINLDQAAEVKGGTVIIEDFQAE